MIKDFYESGNFKGPDIYERILSPSNNMMDNNRMIVRNRYKGSVPYNISKQWELEDKATDIIREVADSSPEGAAGYLSKMQMAYILSGETGVSFDTAKTMIEAGGLGKDSNRILEKPSALKAVFDNVMTTYYSGKSGEAFASYMTTGNKAFIDLADQYDEKSRSYKVPQKGYGWLGNLAVASGSTIGSSGSSMLTGLAIAGVTIGIGALAGGVPGATAAAKAAKTISKIAVGVDAGLSAAGRDAYEIYKAKDAKGNSIDIDTPFARGLFLLNTALQGSIEVIGLSWIPGYRHLFNAMTPKGFANQMVKTAKEKILSYGKEYLEGLVGEGLEEFFQSFASDVFTEGLKAKANAEGSEFEMQKFSDMIAQASKDFGSAVYGMILYGAPSLAIGIGAESAANYEANKYQTFSAGEKSGVMNRGFIAQSKSKVQESKIKENVKEEKIPTINVVSTKEGALPASKTDVENLEELDRRGASKIRVRDVSLDEKAMAEAVKLAQERARIEKAKSEAEKLKTIDIDDEDEKSDEENKTAKQKIVPLKRLPDGRLRTQESNNVILNSDGSESHTLKIGSVGTNTRFGVIDYTLDGNNIRIDSVRTRQGYEGIAEDAIKELGRRYEGYEITWNPESSEQQAIKDSLIKNNPRGSENGLNWYKSLTDLEEAEQVSKIAKAVFTNLSDDESKVGVQILQMAAESQGKSLNQWLTDNEVSFKRGELGAGKKGGIEFSRTENGIKATITAARNADFSTFAHEAFHLIRQTTNQSQALAKALREASVTDEFKTYIKEHHDIVHMSPDDAVKALRDFSDEWTTDQEELAATLFESYLRDNATLSPKLKNIFDKIRDWLMRIYRGLKSTVKLDERITKAFDSLFDSNVSSTDTETLKSDKKLQFSHVLHQTTDPFVNKKENRESIAEFVVELESHDPEKKYSVSDFYKPYARCPIVLRELGYNDLPLWMRKSKVSRILAEHSDMDIDTIGLAVMSISDPLAVFDSIDSKGNVRKNQLVVVTEVENDNGDRVIVPLHMNEKADRIEVDIIASAYYKESGAIYDKWVSLGALKYIKSKEAGSQLMPLQLRGRESQLHLQNILHRDDIVNKYSYGKDMLYQTTDPNQNLRYGYDVTDTADLDERNKLMAEGYDGIINKYEDETTEHIAVNSNQSAANKLEKELKENNEAVLSQSDKKDVVEVDGVLYVKDDKGFDYSKDNIRRLKDEVSKEINSIRILEQDRKDNREFEERRTVNGRYPRLRKGLSQFFSFTKGWNGKEPNIPSIEQKWDKFGYINFNNIVIRSHEDIAKLWSIYRNPKLECFHIVFTKDDKIVDSLALSSGIASSSFASLSMKGWDENVKIFSERMQNNGANGYYLLHNHPSGDITPSRQDENITQGYNLHIPGLKGHIILDHNKYTFIDPTNKITENKLKGFHDIETDEGLFKAGFNSESIAQAYSKTGNKKTSILFTRKDPAGVKIISIIPIHGKEYLDLDRMLDIAENNFFAGAFIITDNKEKYKEIQYGLSNQKHFFRDLLLLKDGYLFASAMREQNPYINILNGFVEVPDLLNRRKIERGVDLSKPIFQSGDKTLFQLDTSFTEEAKSFSNKKDFKTSFENLYGSADEEKLEKVWENAHQEEGSVETGNLSDLELDDIFTNLMAKDESLDAFIAGLKSLSEFRNEVENTLPRNVDEEDWQRYEEAKKIEDSINPWVMEIANSKETLNKTNKEKLRTLFNDNPRMYRELYSIATGDTSLTSMQDGNFLPDIKEPTIKRLSLADRRKLSENIKDENLKAKIISGEETLVGESEKAAKRIDAEIKELENKIKKIETQKRKLNAELENSKNHLAQLNEEVKEARKALDKTNRSIRNKLDRGKRVSANEISSRKAIQDKIELLEKQISDFYEQFKDEKKELRLQSTITKNEAVKKALNKYRTQLKEKKDEARAIERNLKYKEGLARSIVEKPSKAIAFEYAEQINAIRQFVDPHSRSPYVKYNGEVMPVDDFREKMSLNPDLLGLTKYQMDRLLKKDINEWKISELEEMAEIVEKLRFEGRLVWQAKIDRRNYEAQMQIDSLLRTIRSNPKYKEPSDEPLPLTGEAAQNRRKLKAQKNTWYLKTLNMDRKARMLDGDKEGPAYKLLVEEKRNLQSEEARIKSLRSDPVFKLMKKHGIKTVDLYDAYSISLGDRTEKYSLSDLAYGILAKKEIRNYEAVAYGNFVSIREKEELNHDNELIKNLGDWRYSKFYEQATEIISNLPGVMEVFEAIEADLQKQAPRIEKVLNEEYNEGMSYALYYLPLKRIDFTGDSLASSILDDFFNRNAGKNLTTPKKGFTKTRMDISPDGQSPTTMDLFGVWLKAMDEQEHMIATTEYSRKLNRIFENASSRDVRANITSTFGKAMMDDIDNYLKEIANPNVFTDTQKLNSTLKLLRGNLYSAYLGYKMSSIVLQAVTSPMPYLSEVGPIALAKGLLQMTFNPLKTWNFIKEMSPFMANRSMNPVIDEIRERSVSYSDPKYKQVMNKFQEIGVYGLDLIDRWAVSGGWLACYEKELSKMEFQSDPNSMAEAARRADAVVYKTQPLGDITELAPLFKTGSEFARAILQFTTSLNVIWNNITYDVPKAFKNHELRKGIGMIFGYAMAGILLQAVRGKFKDDDDVDDYLKTLSYAALSQPATGVPLVGSMLDSLLEYGITGEGHIYYNTSIFPGLVKLSQGAIKLKKGDIDKAVSDIVEGGGLIVGLPVSGFKEAQKVFFTDGFHPEVMLGQDLSKKSSY